jgi:hypothetical protein
MNFKNYLDYIIYTIIVFFIILIFSQIYEKMNKKTLIEGLKNNKTKGVVTKVNSSTLTTTPATLASTNSKPGYLSGFVDASQVLVSSSKTLENVLRNIGGVIGTLENNINNLQTDVEDLKIKYDELEIVDESEELNSGDRFLI